MLDNDDYEILKDSFIDSQRLFTKLNIVANNIENMDFDENGLYQEGDYSEGDSLSILQIS